MHPFPFFLQQSSFIVFFPDSFPCPFNLYSKFYDLSSCSDLLEDAGDDDLFHVRLVHGQVLIAFDELHDRLHRWVQLQRVELLLQVFVQVLQLWRHILEGSILDLTHT